MARLAVNDAESRSRLLNLLLKNLVRQTAIGDSVGDLRLRRGRIVELGRGLAPRRREKALDLTGFRVLPGLVNAHDHLSLDLLPHLGEPPYDSLYRFAAEVYQPERAPICDVLRVAPLDRFEWGAYKNLISGVTTVVHHDPYPRRLLLRRRFPVHVLRRYGWSHSLRFGDDPAAAYRRAGRKPFIIHVAEGIDEECFNEIDRLHAAGLLRRNTVMVHGIAMTADQRARVIAARASLVWCPVSNLRLYGRTAPLNELTGCIRLALGTDSTLTGSATLFDEMRAAAETGLATPEEILEMVTTAPADIFDLGARRGIDVGTIADLLVLPEIGCGAAQTLLRARPVDLALVMVSGEGHLARPELADALVLGEPNALLEGAPRWLCGDLEGLQQRIAGAAGEQALELHPVWRMLRPLRDSEDGSGRAECDRLGDHKP